MAITGTGTEQDPLIVHDYDELQSLKTYSGEMMKYAKLANDINCNDYGEDFAWETVDLGDGSASGMTMILDLDGHAIKNILVKPSNYMFNLKTYGSRVSKITNGKILNVFLNGASGFCRGATDLVGLSISINGTGAISDIIINEETTYPPVIQNCAIYFESVKLNAGFLSSKANDEFVKNCDIRVNIADINGKNLYGKTSGYGGSIASISDCRITGKIAGQAPSYNGARRAVISSTTSNMNSCCVDLDFSGLQADNGVTFVIDKIVNSTVSNSAINKDKGTPEWRERTDAYLVTSQEIINGDALRAKGFVVVNTV